MASPEAVTGDDEALKDLHRVVLDGLLEGCQVVSFDYRYLYVNDALVKQAKVGRDGLIGRTMMEVYPGIDDTPMFATLRECMESRRPAKMENDFTFPDSSMGYFQLSFEPVPQGVAILSVDVTERVLVETPLRRSRRALMVLSECNQTLVRATDELRFMDDVCRLAIEKGGYLLAWIGMKAEGENRDVVPVASFGRDDGYTEAAKINWSGSERGLGPMGRALETRRPVVVRSVANDSSFSPWREAAVERGFASGIVLPLEVGGECVGAIALYAAEEGSFDNEELVLLEELALDLGYGIETLRAREAGDQAEAHVLHLNRVLRGIRNVNQLITRERDPKTLVQRAAAILVESRGYFASCIALIDDGWPNAVGCDGPERTRVPIQRMLEGGELPECMQTAWENRSLELRKDPLTICPDCPVVADCDEPRDTIAVCLEADERAYGALLVTMPTDMVEDPEEIGLLREVAEDLAFALRSIELERGHRAAESALSASEDRHRQLVDNLEAVVFSTDLQGRITLMNQAVQRIFSFEVKEVLGRPFTEMVHSADLSRVRESLARVAGGSAEKFEFRGFDKEGKIRHLRVTSNAKMERGAPVGVHGIMMDITEQRKAEEQLANTQRLEAVGKLAGGVAHDFNNMLSVIMSYTQFAIEDLSPSDPIRADLEEVHAAGRRATDLTRQLLAFSRKQVLEPKVINLNKVLNGIEKMLRRLLGEDVIFTTRLSPDIGSVKADPGQMEQVLMNFAVNSRDAMPEGGELIIETANVDIDKEYAQDCPGLEPGRFVMLSVTDEGCGMDPDTLAHAFDPFFTTKEKDKGTGLGLATVYGIVKQSDGHILVKSEPGHGSSFKVFLPRVDAAPAETSHGRSKDRARGSETILVVEDEDAVRRLTERILKKAGYRVLAAANGGEALLICEKHGDEIDLLLTDVVMPKMSGKELCERLSKICPRIRSLYMSGFTDHLIVHQGVLESGARLVNKPFTAAELTRQVREVLDEE